ncbi:SNF2 family N-terminal domain-containing protein [Hygrophoropsis aurantiaca]|uniref:SNF2 family N-terminal domain-containing protein n=1 Tax=Hygrophoropsis aurantiaca TaxID=72124 RepID=A0ACB8AQ77_9AGAM|nr:SNF2 family N-terminal domain-containing protein [Hygrophoropsis aurantiaca]
MSKHSIDYSKSARATCKGPAPCTGSIIAIGSLRYGQVILEDFGATVNWRHWGCVTPDILSNLATCNQNDIIGFDNLRPEDQAKVRLAMSRRRVDLSDVPESAKIPVSATLRNVAPPAPSQSKRKATFDVDPAKSGSSSIQTKNASTSSRHSIRSAQEEDSDEVMIIEPETVDELYCMMDTNVVGIQYYKGLVGPGEEVRLIREPHNQYDRNAIQVKNIGGMQVGHIPRTVASRLAPLLDRHAVTVEGVMNEGNLTRSSYSLSITLKIYGAFDKRDTLEPQLIWATPHQRGFPARGGGGVPGAPAYNAHGPSSSSAASSAPSASQSSNQKRGAASSTAAQTKAQQEAIKKQQEAIRKQQESLQKATELKQMLNSLEKVDDEGRRSSLLDTLCSTDDVLNLPVHPNPPGIASGDMKVDLLKHQSQALQWCIEHEYPVLPKTESDKPVQFWQYRKAGSKAFYFNIATKTPQELTSPPLLGRGALVGDSMGLGKTLTMLALILATKKDVPTDHSASTLIVVPLSVISNWEKQIDDHCVEGALSACVYYGQARNMTPEQLKQHDVVITTYQTVANEADIGGVADVNEPPKKKKKNSDKGLFDVKWKRIILDEGHNIRNPKTKMAKAVCKLTAQRRWVLSGTPIINSPRDLGSILTFLQICRPLDNEDFYKRLLLRPLKDGDPSGAELLRALMSHICIRRTKEMQDSEGNHLVPLPPVEMTMIPVTLSDEARALYDAVEDISKQRVENFMNQNGGMNVTVTTNVLSMLTRLRQLALHPGLVPTNYLEQLRAAEESDSAPHSTIQITPQRKLELQSFLSQVIEDNEECPICFSIMTDPRITACSHPFCLACISEVIARDPKCPMDRRPLGMGDLIESAPPTELTQVPIHRQSETKDEGGLRSGSSAKVEQLIHLLQLTPAGEKSLVFSQFTGFLDKIGEALEENGISYVRFDGSMSAKRRQETLERFSIPLDDATSTTATDEAPLPTARRTRASRVPASFDEDDTMVADDDSDFVAEDDDDDFDEAISTRAKRSKTKAKGKGKANPKAKAASRASKANFDNALSNEENPKVMLISLKAGALGLNLTVANNVYLMDPWWQEGIESQAIDRCNRIGQKKPVHVYQLIAENTVESKVIDIQERKKLLIQQAFSGIKRTETQRQKKEARLQELIELFGIRQQAASQRMN